MVASFDGLGVGFTGPQGTATVRYTSQQIKLEGEGGILGRAVIVHRDLRDFDPMAWDFVLNFARDNNLQVTEACPVEAPRR